MKKLSYWLGEAFPHLFQTPPFTQGDISTEPRLYNPVMSFRRMAVLMSVGLLSGCQSAPATATLFPSPVVWSPPAATRTPAFPMPAVSVTPLPLPTPTALMYKVVSGDTFISIAAHFGLSVDALRAANPDVQEHFLSIGQTLIIPAQSGTPAVPRPTPTPAGAQAGPVQCRRQATGGEWCIVLVANPGPVPVEGVLVRFSLYTDPAADPSFSREAELSVSRLQPGERAPAAVFVPPSEAKGEIARAEVIAAIPSDPGGPAVPATVLSQETFALEGGLGVEFDVRVSPSAVDSAGRIDAVFTLLDSSGQPVGFRLMRADGEWQPGESVHFSLRAYALGGAVEKGELLVQAFPAAAENGQPTAAPTAGG